MKATLPQKLATGLGWFSLGLGLAEILAPRWFIRTLGLRGHHNLLRSYGLREIGAGLGLLLSKNPAPWMWGRVVGDGLDLGTAAANLQRDNPKRLNVATALVNLISVTALDWYTARQLSKPGQPPRPAKQSRLQQAAARRRMAAPTPSTARAPTSTAPAAHESRTEEAPLVDLNTAFAQAESHQR